MARSADESLLMCRRRRQLVVVQWMALAVCCCAWLLLLLLSPPSVASFQYARCFQKLERHSLDSSQPLTEIFRTSPQECLAQCIQHTGNGDGPDAAILCRSIVYDHLQHSCRLYDHNGRKVPAVLHPANGFDLYVRTASSQECVGPAQRLLHAKKKAALYAAPNQPAAGGGGNGGNVDTGAAAVAPQPEQQIGTDEQELGALLDELEQRRNSNNNKGEQSNHVLKEATTNGEQQQLIDCAANPTGFLAFKGGQREEEEQEREVDKGNEPQEFIGLSRQECAELCAQNMGPDAKHSPCAGFSHNPGGGKCRFHQALAQGELALQSAGGAVYAEKWCIPAHRYGLCREPSMFRIQLQQRYSPRCVPLAVLEQVPTLVDCIQKCMDQLGCRSASFHSPSLRCLLHRESPVAFLLETTEPGWTLAENGCDNNNREGGGAGGGRIGLVDSEDGQIGGGKQKDDGDGGAEQNRQQQQEAEVAANNRPRAFGQPMVNCADGTGGMGMGGMPALGMLSGILFGQQQQNGR